MAQALLEDAPTLFLNAQLIDGYGGPPVEDGAVRVEDNKITHVGRTADWGENPDGNQRVIDLRGKALLPGLTEGHFHISFWGVRELRRRSRGGAEGCPPEHPGGLRRNQDVRARRRPAARAAGPPAGGDDVLPGGDPGPGPGGAHAQPADRGARARQRRRQALRRV